MSESMASLTPQEEPLRDTLHAIQSSQPPKEASRSVEHSRIFSSIPTGLKLRRVETPPLFQIFDDNAFLIKAPATMMRFIDTLHYHRPTENERIHFGIPSAKERLSLHNLNDILVCCGARKGFRFTSREIACFRDIVGHLDIVYTRLDRLFHEMPLAVSRYRFGNSIATIYDFPELMHSVQTDMEINDEGADDSITLQAFIFQFVAQQYMRSYAKLRDEIVLLQARFQHLYSDAHMERNSCEIAEPIESELEAKTHHPFPIFLYILIRLYHYDKRGNYQTWRSSLPSQSITSIADFAEFLTEILCSPSKFLFLTFEELENLYQLLQILHTAAVHALTSLYPNLIRSLAFLLAPSLNLYSLIFLALSMNSAIYLATAQLMCVKVGIALNVYTGEDDVLSKAAQEDKGGWTSAVVIDRYASPIDAKGAILVVEMHKTLEIKEFLVPENPMQWIPELQPKERETCAEDMDDLTNLTQLDSYTILTALEERFKRQEIYTNTGSILIAINPFQHLCGLYNFSELNRYLTYQKSADHIPLKPHIYKVAGEAYKAMQHPISSKCRDQSILVSGESGSGKTESTKFLMEYLAHAGDHRQTTRSTRSSSASTASTNSLSASSTGAISSSIAAKVLQTNVLLESFGNARTLRNDNSSRFGKFIKLHFAQNGKLIGASIQTYLLEKVRLVSQANNERNYHIFYEMLLGACEAEKLRWRVNAPDDINIIASFRYLNQSGCYSRRDGVEETKTYKRILNAMEEIGFSLDERNGVFDILSALLHIGNLVFTQTDKVQDDLQSSCGSGVTTVLTPESNFYRDAAAHLLSVDVERFEEALSVRKIRAGTDFVSVKLSSDQANNARDAFAKSLYSRLFDWLIWKMNVFLKTSAEGKSSHDVRFIGILDIFGFEVFPHNSFEQLCINFANETLQQQFNDYVFKMEQQEYEAQGVEWTYVEYADNQDVVNLIAQRPTGIFSLIDEECLMPKGNDTTLASKLYRALDTHKRFLTSSSQKAAGLFTILHYAGEVEYATNGFLDKNKDVLHQEAVDLLFHAPREKSFTRVLSEYSMQLTSRSKSSPRMRVSATKQRGASVGWQFKEQLGDLLETLCQTNPHYVRCLKPNDSCSPTQFDRERTLNQLQCNGVMEAVRVARAGYPIRISHDEFLGRYFSLKREKLSRAYASSSNYLDATRGLSATSLLLAEVEELVHDLLVILPRVWTTESQNQDRAFATECMQRGLQPGITKVFLKKETFEKMESLRAQSLQKYMVAIFNAVVSSHSLRRFRRLRRATIAIQRRFRYKRQRLAALQRERILKASKIKRFMRMIIVRNRYQRLKLAVRALQCRYRYLVILRSLRSSADSSVISNDVEGAASFVSMHTPSIIQDDVKQEIEIVEPNRSSRSSRPRRSVSEFSEKSIHIPQEDKTQLSNSFRTTRSSRAVALPRLDVVQETQWINDEDRFSCHICNKRFNVFKRKHHCRACGEVICSSCSLHHRIQTRSMRVCVSCVAFHSLDSPSFKVQPASSDLPFDGSQNLNFSWTNAWPEPPYPDDEVDRLLILRELNIRSLAASGKFNMYCEVAAKTMKCPIAYVSIIEETEQMLVANIGMAHTILPRELSFCSHTICESQVLVVLDTKTDPRFRDNPMVKGDKGAVKIRHYAGATIFSKEGHALGTVAVLDTKPRREIDRDHIGMLQHLSFLASEKMMQSSETELI